MDKKKLNELYLLKEAVLDALLEYNRLQQIVDELPEKDKEVYDSIVLF